MFAPSSRRASTEAPRNRRQDCTVGGSDHDESMNNPSATESTPRDLPSVDTLLDELEQYAEMSIDAQYGTLSASLVLDYIAKLRHAL